MAISIKNHEDRITALEKKSGSYFVKSVKLMGEPVSGILTGTSPNIQNTDVNIFSVTAGKVHVKPGTYLCISSLFGWRPGTGTGYISLSLQSDNGTLDDYASYKFNDHGGGGQTCTSLITLSSATNIWSQYSTSGANLINNQFFTVLKLYYNFSYNITREFYKVKFKLKHYLCSHLQKFI